jgi:hypothetical protein
MERGKSKRRRNTYGVPRFKNIQPSGSDVFRRYEDFRKHMRRKRLMPSCEGMVDVGLRAYVDHWQRIRGLQQQDGQACSQAPIEQ